MLVLFLLCLVKIFILTNVFSWPGMVWDGFWDNVWAKQKENRHQLLMSVRGTEWGNAGTHAIHISSHLCILLYSLWYNTSPWCILLFPSRSFQACLSSWEIRSSFALDILLTFCLVKWIKNIFWCWNRRQTMESLIDAVVWGSMLPLSLGFSSKRSPTILLLKCQHVWVTWRIK